MENWKPIPCYEGLYEVSNLGRIRSMDRFIYQRSKWGMMMKRPVKGRILNGCTPSKHKRYLKVYLASPTIKGKSCEIHRLVALAFVPNPQNKATVNHKNGNRHDNRAENLEWLTHSENTKHAWTTGLCKDVGRKHGKRVRCIETQIVYESRDYAGRVFAKDGENPRSVSMQIGRCALGKAKTAVGYTWEYL